MNLAKYYIIHLMFKNAEKTKQMALTCGLVACYYTDM